MNERLGLREQLGEMHGDYLKFRRRSLKPGDFIQRVSDKFRDRMVEMSARRLVGAKPEDRTNIAREIDTGISGYIVLGGDFQRNFWRDTALRAIDLLKEDVVDQVPSN